MTTVRKRGRSDNGADTPLPLLSLIERQRWAAMPRAARLIGRRFGIRSVSTATAIAELAGFAIGGDQ